MVNANASFQAQHCKSGASVAIEDQIVVASASEIPDSIIDFGDLGQIKERWRGGHFVAQKCCDAAFYT
jgi:hypothetical protein